MKFPISSHVLIDGAEHVVTGAPVWRNGVLVQRVRPIGEHGSFDVAMTRMEAVK